MVILVLIIYFIVWKDVVPSRQREGSPLEMAQAKKSRLL